MATNKSSNMLSVYSGTLAALLAVGAAISLALGGRIVPQFVLLLTVGYLATGGRYKWLYILYKTLPRDVLAMYCFLRLNIQLWWWTKYKMTVPAVFEKLVIKQPNKIAFHFEDEKWTYLQLDEFSNQVAHHFKQLGYKRGDAVALFMDTRPEYVGIWLGLSKIGVVAALVNSNLRQKPLVHSVEAAECKAIIYDLGLMEAVHEVVTDSPLSSLPLFQFNPKPFTKPKQLNNASDLHTALSQASKRGLPADLEMGKPSDKLVYIYTSGTTGLPKAAVINHLRFMFMVYGVREMLCLRTDDVVYTALPLYHSAGGMLGVGQVLIGGATVALRRKFSASNFWADCIKYRCTAAQYIGEICRYLLSTPSKPEDKLHEVRIMFGNGLRPQIWEQFVERFSIEQIGEFYGATEGNSNLVNNDSTVGAVGFTPRYASAVYPVGLIRVDEDTLEEIRGPDGLCIPCKPGESGVFVGKIIASKPQSAFTGYADKAASQKKILHNVFKQGDKVFNSGDILVMDELGYFYFKDRTGDTFRWRGENVATSEVEAVISNVLGLKDAAVFGVEIPDVEGRAGMAAIVDPEGVLNLTTLANGIKQNLPGYARPLFVRVLHELPMTGTYKLKKRDLQLDGFDINKITDPVYFANGKGDFVLLTKELHSDILSGKVRL